MVLERTVSRVTPNESANFTESYTFHLDIDGSWNVTEMVPVIGM